mgnify:CR=1 FL=1
MANLRTAMDCTDPYWQFCREERNFTALLYHALLSGENLNRFVHNLMGMGIVPREWVPFNPEDVPVYVEFAIPRDLWARSATAPSDLDTINAMRRRAVLELLRPGNREDLAHCSVAEWNAHFGAKPVSQEWIQFPGRWTVTGFDKMIRDDEEFLRTCKFKWAFNIKPDLVIQMTPDQAIVIEAKYESGESAYPSSGPARALVEKRAGRLVGQTELQEFLFEDLLGIEAVHLHISRNKDISMSGQKGHALTWEEALLGVNDFAHIRPWVQEWIERLRDTSDTNRN